MTPVVSVVTVVRNDRIGLERTITSLAGLDLEMHYEMLIIDGASIDGTVAVAEDHRESSPEQVRVSSQPDSGPYDAMNRGLDLATGDFVLFLNAGDELASVGALAGALGVASTHSYDVLFCDADIRSEEGRSVRIRSARAPERAILHTVPGNQQATLYRRSTVFESWRYSLRYDIAGDYELAASAHRRGLSMGIAPIVLARFSLGGVSSRRPAQLAAECAAIQREALDLSLPLRVGSYLRRMAAALAVRFLSWEPIVDRRHRKRVA